MPMEEFVKELHSCCKCQDTCLKDWVRFPFPEPFLGNPNAKFAIVGNNPGLIQEEPSKREELVRYFEKIENYVNSYKEFRLSLREYKEWRWVKGYVDAYNILTNRSLNIDDSSKVDAFKENAIILNVIKCSTEDFERISKWAKEEAKNNCISYLNRQLANIQPKVILTHGKFACDTMIDMLKSGTEYKVDTASCNIDTLAARMDEISKEYVIAKNRNGHKSLFLFNKHLSYHGPAMKSVNQNIEQKRRIVKELLSMPK